MSRSDPTRPRPSIAPEFSRPGRLASVLGNAGPVDSGSALQPTAKGPGDHHLAWTVYGVGSIWQTAAENAARLDGVDLGAWLETTIREAAAAQGLVPPGSRERP